MPFIQGNAEFGVRSPRPVKFCTNPRTQAARGDVLLSVRAPVGALNLANEQLCVGRGLAAITATGVDPGFLWYALAREVSNLARVSQGSTFVAVNRADLHKLEFRLPSPNEQRKIAAVLESVDDATHKTQAVIDEAQTVKRGLMQELFTRGVPGRHRRFKETEIGEVPEDWIAMTLSDAAAVVGGGTPKRSEPAYYLVQHHVRRLRRLAAGTTFPEVSKRAVRSFRVHMPPLSEQRKIAAICSSVNDRIETNQAVMERLQVVKRGLMAALLTGALRVTPATKAA